MILECTGFAFLFVQVTCKGPDPAPVVVCPPVREWSMDFRRKIAAEMRAAPNGAMAEVVRQTIGDRDVARACAGAKARTKKAGGKK